MYIAKKKKKKGLMNVRKITKHVLGGGGLLTFLGELSAPTHLISAQGRLKKNKPIGFNENMKFPAILYLLYDFDKPNCCSSSFCRPLLTFRAPVLVENRLDFRTHRKTLTIRNYNHELLEYALFMRRQQSQTVYNSGSQAVHRGDLGTLRARLPGAPQPIRKKNKYKHIFIYNNLT